MAKRGKGFFKKQDTQFQRGHTVNGVKRTGYRCVVARSSDGRIRLQGQQPKQQQNKVTRPCRRYTQKAFKKFVKKGPKGQLRVPGADGKEGSAIVIRPKKEVPKTNPTRMRGPLTYQLEEGNIIVEKGRLMQAINVAIKAHREFPCDNMNLDLVDFTPWGHYIKAKVCCTNCGYKLQHSAKLYEEAKKQGRGPKEAKGNLRLQWILQEMPIGNTKARLILAALGIRPGSVSGMQLNANKVGEATVALNENDMADLVEEVKDILEQRGTDHPDEISAAFDGRYDGASLKSWATPGHGANAATGVIVETVTDQKKVIAMTHVNKRCPLGTRLRQKDNNVKCGLGDNSHEGCTATLSYSENISERDMAKDMATKLLDNHGIVISHITTDSDAQGPHGIEEAYAEKGVNKEVTKYKDLTHLGASQRRRINNHKFDSDSFGQTMSGNKWLYDERMRCKQALAHDVEVRCAITLRALFDHYDDNIKHIEANVGKVVDYMMACYSGNHVKCHTAPLAQLAGCCGTEGRTWFQTSEHLRGQKMTSLNLSAKDDDFIRSVIALKLSPIGIHDVAQLTSTQKVEAVNRAINVSDPKNNHWSRNACARNHAAVHRVNHGPAESIKRKLEYGGCALPDDSPAKKAVDDYGKKLIYSHSRQQQEAVRLRRRELKKEKIHGFYKNALKKSNPGDYKKYQLDEARQERRQMESEIDIIPGTSHDENVAETNDRLVAARQKVKDAKKEVKKHNREIEKKKLAANMKRRRTYAKNKKIHQARRKSQVTQRDTHYNTGSKEDRQIKHEHAYSTWRK